MRVEDYSVEFHADGAADLIRGNLVNQGFCRVCKAFTADDIAVLRDGLEELIAAPPSEPGLTWRSPASRGGTVIQRISRSNLFSSHIDQAVVEAEQLLQLGSWIFGGEPEDIGVATGLEGSDGVVAVIKDPRNTSEHAQLKWHRDDTFTGHLSINPFVNCGIYLDFSDARSGALLVVPRSRPFPRASKESVDFVADQVMIEAQAGDVVVHSSDVWHRSGAAAPASHRRRVIYGNVFRTRN
jgi:hypothetical protein